MVFSALLKCLSHGNRNRTRLRGNLIVITARKRSLGQGNVFTSVCHSVHNCGGGFPPCITGHMTGGLHLGGHYLIADILQ